MWNISDLRQLIQSNGGDSCLLSIVFNNVSRATFEKDQFIFDEVFTTIGDTEIVKIIQKDIKEKPLIHYKPVELIEGLLFVTTPDDFDKVDKRYLLA